MSIKLHTVWVVNVVIWVVIVKLKTIEVGLTWV